MMHLGAHYPVPMAPGLVETYNGTEAAGCAYFSEFSPTLPS